MRFSKHEISELRKYLERINKDKVKVQKGYKSYREIGRIKGLIAEILLSDQLNEPGYKHVENWIYLYSSLDYIFSYELNIKNWRELSKSKISNFNKNNYNLENLLKNLRILTNNSLIRFSPLDYKPVSTSDINYKNLNSRDINSDIVWINKKTKNPLTINSFYFDDFNIESNIKVGLQVKCSKDGVSYLSSREKRYNVPIVYFGYSNDFNTTLQEINL